MIILTIAYKKGGKGYDYLLLNPEKAKIDRSKPLAVVVGAGPRDFIPTYAIDARKADSLPPHVTKALRLYPDNEARMAEMPKKIDAGEKELPISSDGRISLAEYERYSRKVAIDSLAREVEREKKKLGRRV